MGIKSVKFNGLEPLMEKESLDFKTWEYSYNFKILLIRTLLFFMGVFGPYIISSICISAKILLYKESFSVGEALLVMINFGLLEKPIKFIPGTFFLFN